MADAQATIDTRALEAAVEARTLAQLARQDIQMHKDYCIERDRIAEVERKDAKRERHDFRAEVALTLERMRAGSDKKFDDMIASMRQLHGRMNAGLVAVVMVLLALVGALFWKLMGW